MVEQDLAARQADREVLGDEGDIALVDELAQFLAEQAEGGPPDADDVLLGDGRPADLAAVHERAVVAAQVDDLVPAVAEVAQFRVVPGHAEIRDHQVVAWVAPDAQQPGGRAHYRGGPAVHAADPGADAGVPAAPVHRAHHHRPVVGMAEPQDAVLGDLHLADTPGPEESPVGAPGVLEDPRVAVDPEHGVPPGDAGVVDHYLGAGITADPVLRASAQRLVGSLGLHHKHRGIRRRDEALVHLPSLWRFNAR